VRARGFTLVEVMVALAVVAIALPAVMMALYQQTDDTAYLRDKSMAHMVAANKLAEIRLVIASTRNLSASKDSGLAQMADRDWHWWVETKTTEVEKFYRVEITVASEEEQREQPLYTLNAFMSGDLQIDPEGLLGGGTDSDTGDNGDTPVPASDNSGNTPAIPDGVDIPDKLKQRLPNGRS
jgi:general secretion pathway protein I